MAEKKKIKKTKTTKTTKKSKPAKAKKIKATPVEQIKPQKQPLDFGDGIVGQVVNFVKANLKITAASIIGLIVVIFLFNIAGSSKDKANEKSWQKLFVAKQEYFSQEKNATKKSYEQIDKLCKKYPRSEACLHGNIFKASMLIHNDANVKASIKILNQVLENDKLDTRTTKPLLMLMLASAYQVNGESEKSLEISQSFIENYPTHYGLPQAILLRAQAHVAQQEIEDAVLNYQTIKENYPNTYWEVIASFELDNL